MVNAAESHRDDSGSFRLSFFSVLPRSPLYCPQLYHWVGVRDFIFLPSWVGGYEVDTCQERRPPLPMRSKIREWVGQGEAGLGGGMRATAWAHTYVRRAINEGMSRWSGAGALGPSAGLSQY